MDGQRALGRRRTRRPLPEDRLEDLIRAAAAVFSRRGYRRTQMAEVAHQMGVSPGNLYNYVEGKDALFYLVLRRGFGERPGEQPPELPVTGASVEVTSNWVARRLDFVSDFPELEAAFARTRPADPRGELEGVVGELYDVLVRVRVGVDVLERSIEDVPELARIFAGVRRELFARYERYLRQRAAGGAIRVEHPQAVAHLLVELCSWAARRRPHDPEAAQISDVVARQAVCRFTTNALLAPAGPSALRDGSQPTQQQR
ncbi:MAG TPA: TetR/AcrR family transcriptional regulator [Actinomycetes bacterium]|nr:TetR/AcrR family transcriptional regulator [Actinomycetes bacterium]